MSTMTNNPTPEQFIEALNRWKMTPEERELADKKKLVEDVSKVIASFIILFLAPTIIWAALVYLVGFEVAWLKVFGVYLIFNIVKNIIRISFKK
jgi:hypothetical protein